MELAQQATRSTKRNTTIEQGGAMSEELIIERVNGQLAILIPSDVSEAADLREGDAVRLLKSNDEPTQDERIRERLESFMDTYTPDLERLAQ
ncbi:MAG: hypothetical protein RhofKO_29460 [Rhodothermales bacterium]